MSVAFDTNFLVDLAREDNEAWEAWETLHARLPHLRRLVTPTAFVELGWLARQGRTAMLRQDARKAVQQLVPVWRIQPVSLAPVQHGIVEEMARRLRWRGLLPEEEKHDALIVAEAAFLECVLLVSDDSLVRGLDFGTLSDVLQEFDLEPPVILTPKEIVRRFSH